jgi:NitT/TauT family transport system permease protein
MRPALLLRLATVLGFVLLLEILCRLGVIPNFTMIPPSAMALGLYQLLLSGVLLPDLKTTLGGVAIAVTAAILVGFLAGALLHAVPRLRRTLDPFFASYYAVPVWAFYPLFIVLFGLNDIPKVIIGFLYAVVAMIVNTLNGLDRVPPVLRKMARTHQMGRGATVLFIILPSAAPHIFTGVKLSIAYAFIGVVGSEFILASAGIGYQISFAYNNFDNVILYSLILFIILFVSTVNLFLYSWERSILQRRGGR